ncbi:MAG TPA: acyltransferase [Croceibacterium sp.]|nr:acyltransferase [Croceibacterium sp.]
MLPAADPTAANDGRKIAGLEGLRGLMAWWVVIGHLAHTFGATPYLLARNGLAVDVFIILSGFVIYRMIEARQEPYGAYIVRRAARLLPVYLVVLGLSVLLLPVFAEAMRGVPFASERNALRLAQASAALGHLSPHLAAHVGLLQGLVPDGVLRFAPYTIVGQAWSVSLEWQFYLVAPFVWLAIARRQWLPLAALTALAIAIAPSIGGAFIGAKALLFGIGIATELALRDRRARLPLAGCVTLYLLLGGHLIPPLVWAAAFALRGPLAHPLLVYLGSRSYSTYLVHMLPIYLGAYTLNGWLAGEAYIAALAVFTVLFTLAASEASYRLVERPGMALGAWLARQSPKRRLLAEPR